MTLSFYAIQIRSVAQVHRASVARCAGHFTVVCITQLPDQVVVRP